MSTTVALVGRTNVGKSSLFNKLAKSKSALVSEQEGLTRDIKSTSIHLGGKSINLIDTGGFFTSKDDDFEEMILSKAYEAIEYAEVILFVVDKKFGISPFDKEIASLIRKSNKEVIMVINKIDVKTSEGTAIFEELGFKEKVEVSAEHNLGIDQLKTLLFSKVKEEENLFENNIPKICILGKPNVGKSSTINSISNEKKMIVSNVPGTTIDSIDSKITYKNKEYIFIDTAGIRKKSKTTSKEEKFSVIKSLESNKIADLSVIMLDASNFLLDQDRKLIEKARENGKAIIIAVNKVDLLDTAHHECEAKRYYHKIDVLTRNGKEMCHEEDKEQFNEDYPSRFAVAPGDQTFKPVYKKDGYAALLDRKDGRFAALLEERYFLPVSVQGMFSNPDARQSDHEHQHRP